MCVFVCNCLLYLFAWSLSLSLWGLVLLLLYAVRTFEITEIIFKFVQFKCPDIFIYEDTTVISCVSLAPSGMEYKIPTKRQLFYSTIFCCILYSQAYFSPMNDLFYN